MKNKGNSLILVCIIIYIYIIFSASFLIYIFEKKEIVNISKSYLQKEMRKNKDIKRMEIYISKKTNLNDRYFDEDLDNKHIFFSKKESIGGYKLKEVKAKGNDLLLILSKRVLDEEILIYEKATYFNNKLRVKEVMF